MFTTYLRIVQMAIFEKKGLAWSCGIYGQKNLIRIFHKKVTSINQAFENNFLKAPTIWIGPVQNVTWPSGIVWKINGDKGKFVSGHSMIVKFLVSRTTVITFSGPRATQKKKKKQLRNPTGRNTSGREESPRGWNRWCSFARGGLACLRLNRASFTRRNIPT